VFPGSTRSAVYGMTMTIGERVLKAQIKERARPGRSTNRRRQRAQRFVAGTAPPQRLPDERGEHPAGR